MNITFNEEFNCEPQDQDPHWPLFNRVEVTPCVMAHRDDGTAMYKPTHKDLPDEEIACWLVAAFSTENLNSPVPLHACKSKEKAMANAHWWQERLQPSHAE